MKIAYLHCSIHTPGGMERVMLNKAEWLAAHGYEVLVVTTDQRGRAPFFPLPAGVRHIDLGINYTDYRELSVWQKIKGYLPKRRLHRQRLEALLTTEHPDVVVSLYPSESSFIPSLKDGSKKVLELHQNRFFRIQYNNPGLYGVIDRLRSIQDRSIVERFDRFVVLTNEDKGLWGDLHNMVVIPNAAKMQPTAQPTPEKRFIAVGRLDYQKSFDRLLQAWTQALADGKHPDWHLDIYGQGEWHDMLINMIEQAGIGSNTHIHPPTTDIAAEYARSAALVMTSHYEGFPMVMVEAMACGVPVLTFDYRCGPRDIIRDGENGLIVPDGDIVGMANAMHRIMDDEQLQRHLAQQARMVTDTYAEDKVMHQWVSLFEELMHEKTTAD